METWMHDAIEAAFEEVWTLIAGDLVTHVAPKSIAATVTGSIAETFNIVVGVSDVLRIAVGDGDSQTFVLTAGATRSAANIADDINATAVDFSASDAETYIKLTCDSSGTDLIIEPVEHSAYSILGFASGITYSQDTETSLLTIMDDALVGEGMVFDPAGIRDQNSRDLCFLLSYLVSQSVTIEPTDYFKISGERWDYVENMPIKDAINPLGGIQNIIIVRVRRAVELGHSDDGSSWSFDAS